MTLFEKIIARQVPAVLVYEDDHVVAFRDINPQAPTHLLVVPRKPIARLSEAEPDDHALLGRCLDAARRVAAQEGLRTYRIVMNDGDDAGQTVPHLHFHVLGGRKFTWPPG
jgi:histidine triad (HIT) family protein